MNEDTTFSGQSWIPLKVAVIGSQRKFHRGSG
jgi:hypothetical protein